MADSDDDDYKVGYGRPPRHSRFQPGECGRQRGDKKAIKRSETEAEIFARLRKERITIRIKDVEKKVLKFEAIIRKIESNLLRQGRVADLERYLALAEKYGAPIDTLREDMEAAAQSAMQKMINFLDRSLEDDDPEEVTQREAREAREHTIITTCPNCGPALLATWQAEDDRFLPRRLWSRLRTLFEAMKPVGQLASSAEGG